MEIRRISDDWKTQKAHLIGNGSGCAARRRLVGPQRKLWTRKKQNFWSLEQGGFDMPKKAKKWTSCARDFSPRSAWQPTETISKLSPEAELSRHVSGRPCLGKSVEICIKLCIFSFLLLFCDDAFCTFLFCDFSPRAALSPSLAPPTVVFWINIQHLSQSP